MRSAHRCLRYMTVRTNGERPYRERYIYRTKQCTALHNVCDKSLVCPLTKFDSCRNLFTRSKMEKKNASYRRTIPSESPIRLWNARLLTQFQTGNHGCYGSLHEKLLVKPWFDQAYTSGSFLSSVLDLRELIGSFGFVFWSDSPEYS